MDCQLIEEKSFEINFFFLSFDFKRFIGISFHSFDSFDIFNAYKSFIF